MSTLTREQLARLKDHEAQAFELIERAAIAGARCPKRKPHGPIMGKAVRVLSRCGFIATELFGHNFRQATILVGPNAGKKTAAAPAGWIGRPPVARSYRKVAP